MNTLTLIAITGQIIPVALITVTLVKMALRVLKQRRRAKAKAFVEQDIDWNELYEVQM